MKKRMLLLLTLLVVVLTASFARAEQAYYVQSMRAKVMSEPSFKAKMIAEVPKGFKFNSGTRVGSWVKVNYAGMTGYVSKLLVSANPPMDKASLIKGNEGDISQGVRRRASTYTSAAAARGLTHEDRKRVSAEEEVDYRALEKMEALSFSAEEVSRFIEGGRI